MLRRITDARHGQSRVPIAFSIRYVEPDGTSDVDVRLHPDDAEAWADWCKEDGCTNVIIAPLYSDREIAAIHLLQQLRDTDNRFPPPQSV